MKYLLFIDSNIYLRFYDTNSKEFKKLFKSLEEIKKNLFITSQVKNEVERNKQDVFLRSFIEYERQIIFANISLPEHLEGATDKRLKAWNKNYSAILKKVQNLKKDISKITEELMDSMDKNTDEVTQNLSKLFISSHANSQDQLERARIRKELGNPPGKKADPLGDQITWEQILDVANSISELWIISNDSDYFSKINKECYLNSFLRNELYKINPDITVKCFNTLSEGLKSFNMSYQISGLPSGRELSKITQEENKLNWIGNLFVSGSSGANTFHSSVFQTVSNYNFNSSCQSCGCEAATDDLTSSVKLCKMCNKEFCFSCYGILEFHDPTWPCKRCSPKNVNI